MNAEKWTWKPPPPLGKPEHPAPLWPAVVALAILVAAALTSCTATHPVAATGEVDGGKRGTATVVKVCGFVLSGDGSTATAAHNGAVRFVQTVDVRRTSVLGLVTWSTTIVTGE